LQFTSCILEFEVLCSAMTNLNDARQDTNIPNSPLMQQQKLPCTFVFLYLHSTLGLAKVQPIFVYRSITTDWEVIRNQLLLLETDGKMLLHNH